MEKKSKITEFSKKKQDKGVVCNKKLPLKEGFPMLELSKDTNGFNFSKKHLDAYTLTNKYTITLALEKDGKTVLDNYIVQGDEIKEFFSLYLAGKIDGEIIEIDKFNPEILA